MTYNVTETPPSTTIASLKEQVQTYLGGASVVALDKIKILHNKKPIPPSKQALADVVDGDAKDIEFGVMVMGGAPDPPPQAAPTATAVKDRPPEPAGPGSENAAVEAETGQNPAETTSTAPVSSTMEGVEPTHSAAKSETVQAGEESGQQVLQSPEFWTDLEGFLAQRIRDQDEAKRVRQLFERAFQSSNSAP